MDIDTTVNYLVRLAPPQLKGCCVHVHTTQLGDRFYFLVRKFSCDCNDGHGQLSAAGPGDI
jgi:hypothetical protein